MTTIIGLTDFLNYSNRFGREKIDQVNNIHGRGSYSPEKDFYRIPRHVIGDLCRKKYSLKDLNRNFIRKEHPELFSSISKDKHFNLISSGLIKFCKGNGAGTIFVPPSSYWDYKTLRVKINPEMGLEINGSKYFIKVFFNAEKLSVHNAEMLCCLMSNGFPHLSPTDSVKFAVLDIRRNKLHVQGKPSTSIQKLLEAEAETFIKLWELIDSNHAA